MSERPDKHALIAWASQRRELDLQSKTILKSLAYFAQDDGDTWATVQTLADEANCSVRTVQYRMRDLEAGGYVRDTGRTHRLKGSTRSVPLYVLGPTIAWEDEQAKVEAEAALSMGANSAPIDGVWVQETASMGATVCTRIDHQESPEEQKGAGARAGEDLGAAYGRLEAAYPPAALGVTDRGVARRELADLIGQGVSVDDLVAAAAAYAECPLLRKRTFGPVGLNRWLAEGRYRGFGPFLARAEAARAAGKAGAAAAMGEASAWAGPAALRAALLAPDRLGEAFGLTLDRCRVEGGRLVACTTWALERLKTARDIIEQHGCELVAPNGGN